MSDNLKRYRAIVNSLKQLYPGQLSGRQQQHLHVLAALINGIVGSRKCQLPAIADKLPEKNQRESRIMRFRRWLKNDQITTESYFAPFAAALLEGLASQPLVLVIDGSQVGRGCMCLMLSVIYRNRALPLGWLVFEGTKGHCSEARHLALLEQVYPLIPPDSEVIMLGDGEFDGVNWLQRLTDYGWQYVCRTASNTLMEEEDEHFRLDEWGVMPGDCLSVEQVRFTAQGYLIPLAIAWWKADYATPIYLISSLELAEEACAYYRLRFNIETFFSDQKSRGFHLHKSHLSDPQRLVRLLIAACLAYIWMIYLGALVQQHPEWQAAIHRTSRCDLSLFQLGMALLEHFLNFCLPILVAFSVPLPPVAKCVR